MTPPAHVPFQESEGFAMLQSNQPEIVTLVASPPAGTIGPINNSFIDAALQTLASKKTAGNQIIRVSSIRDVDLELGKVLSDPFKGSIRVQIVGHSISGMLLLGASWIPESDMLARAFKYPYYVLDTNPAPLGLLAKYAGKISEVLLVGCHVGSASSFGYAINGRTLTYTLAELLRCLVRGTDDVVAPDEFDMRGWYAPSAHHRRPKGWRWVDVMPPIWTDPGVDPVQGVRAKATQSFEIRSITSSLLPSLAAREPGDLDPGIRITCQYVAADKPQSALPEISVETDQGPAHLLCGGRFLRWMDTYYEIDQTPQLSAALTAQLGRAGTPRRAPAVLASVAG
jgi:hypothetical protein